MSDFIGYIYGLHNGDEHYRYVGQTVRTVEIRFRRHRNDALYGSEYPIHRWMRKHGVPEIQVATLEVCKTHDDLNAAEKRWIRKLRSEGHDLLNLTDGGGGMSGFGLSAEHKRNLAQIRTGSLNHQAVLDDDKVQDIIRELMAGTAQRVLIEKYGVTQSCISAISRGASWKHIERPEGFFDRARPCTIPAPAIPGIIAMRVAGEEVAKIAKFYGVTDTAVASVLAGNRAAKYYEGLDLPVKRKMHRLTQAEAEEVIQLIHEGWTQTRIADKFGMSRGGVASIAQGRGWRYLPRPWIKD